MTGNGNTATLSRTVGIMLAVGVAVAAVMWGAAGKAGAAVITCKAPGKRLVEVTSVANTTCLAARVDIDDFTDPFAPSFRTPGGYSCTRLVKNTDPNDRVSSWRCVSGAKAYRFSRYGLTPAGVRVKGPSYDKTFRVTRCVNKGETDLVLAGSAPGKFTLKINAPNGKGSLSLNGGTEQDGITARGTVTSVTVGDAGNVVVRGRFTSGITGPFTVTGDCA